LRSLPLGEAIARVTDYLTLQDLSDDWTVLLIEPDAA